MLKIREIKDKSIFQKLDAARLLRKYMICCDFGTGICLPYKGKFTLKLCIGNRSWESGSAKEVKNKYCRWDKRVMEEFTDSYQSLKRFPTVFVYLMDGNWPICFWRDSLLSFMNPDAGI